MTPPSFKGQQWAAAGPDLAFVPMTQPLTGSYFAERWIVQPYTYISEELGLSSR